MKKLILLLFTLPAFATTTVTVGSVTHTSAHFVATAINGGLCWNVEFGTTTGMLVGHTYLSCFAPGSEGSQISWSGWNPSDVIYWRACSYALPDDMSPSECSTETSFTTDSEPS